MRETKPQQNESRELTRRQPTPRQALVLSVVAAWLAAVCVGLGLLAGYEHTPGDAGLPHTDWPARSRIGRNPSGPTLVMFAHPHCPCTRASIGELERLMARCQGRLQARVVFMRPGRFDQTWAETDLWRWAKAIPGVQVVPDVDGQQSQLYNAATSGQTLLYDAEGRLLFSGGITASRGHAGDNFGRSTIVSLLTGGDSDHDSANRSPDACRCSVFGCPLFETERSTSRLDTRLPNSAFQ